MTPLKRAAIGAMVGLILAIFLNADARRLVLEGFNVGPSAALAKSPVSASNFDKLPQPNNRINRRLWIEAAAQRQNRRLSLSDDDISSLVQVTREGGKEDPDNAYWRQLEACFLRLERKPQEALAAWVRASTLARWEDPMDQVILETSNSISGGNPVAWHYAVVLAQRSSASTDFVLSYARELSRTTNINSGLDARVAILKNGELIRRGARSAANGEAGVRVVEIATFPPDVPPITSPRRLLLARAQFTQELASLGRDLDAQVVGKSFKSNDSWTALLSPSSSAERRRDLTIRTLIATPILGVAIFVGLLGGLVWAVSALFQRVKPTAMFFHWAALTPTALLAGAVAMLLTGVAVVALGLWASVMSLCLRPKRERTHAESDLSAGPTVVLGLLSAVLWILWLGYTVGITTPGWELASTVGFSENLYGGSPVLLGLIFIVTSLVLVATPMLSFAYRVEPRLVLALVLRRIGLNMVYISSFVVILGALPLTVWHNELTNTLREIALHEPLHYLGNR